MPSLRSTSASPMHEPSPSETSTWPEALDAASSPIRTMVSDALISSQPQAREQHLDAAVVGDQQERRSSSRRPRPRGSSRASARCRSPSRGRPARVSTIAPSMSVAVAGGVGSISMPVIAASALMYEVPTMLPISPRAESANSLSGSTPSRRHIASASAGGNQQQHGARHVADDPEHDPGDLLLRRAGGLDGVGERQRARSRNGDVDGPPEHPRERGARGPRTDVRQLAQGVELEFGVLGAHGGGVLSQAATRAGVVVSTASQSMIRAICPSDMTAAARQSGVLGDLGRQRAGDQLALAEQGSDGDREGAGGSADDHGVLGVGRRRAAVALGGVDDRHDAVAHDEHAAAGDRANRVVGQAHRALDAVERDRERAAVRLDQQRRHDGQRQRQADLRHACPRPSSEVIRTSPPSSRTVVRTASMPTPRPEMSLVTSAVEKPGVEEQLDGLGGSRSSSIASSAISPRSAALRATFAGSIAAAVVARPR